MKQLYAYSVAENLRQGFDANGNATRRIDGSQDITLTYDAENRLAVRLGSVTTSYVYDADGNRVKETIAGVTRVFVGNYYELDNGTVKKYYYAGATRVAESSGGVLYYLLTDHLGSTALTLDSSGNRLDPNVELRYYPYGGVRYNPGGQVTTYRFTGQRWDSGTALYFYQSRWYDPVIGRFLAADTLVPQPGNPQNLNRYSYALNNSVRFTDPTGHFEIDAIRAYLYGEYGEDEGDKILQAWQADKDWWGLLGKAQGGDTLYRYGYDDSGRPSMDSYQFEGEGQTLLTGLSTGKGSHTDIGLNNVYANKGVGLAGIHVNKNLGVEYLGSTANMTTWFHRVSWGEDKLLDSVRTVIFTGIGLIGGRIPTVVGFLSGVFGDEIDALPGTQEDDYQLRVWMGRQEGRMIESFEVDQNWRFSRLDLTYVPNGFSVQTWWACDNGRRQ